MFEGLDGAKVFVDPKSHRLIDGTTLDYDTSLVSRGFIFNNPNAKSTAAAGRRFSVNSLARVARSLVRGA